jgi:hypothetical protein
MAGGEDLAASLSGSLIELFPELGER